MLAPSCICLSEADRFESEGFTLTAKHLRIQHAADKGHITGGAFPRKDQMSEQEESSISAMVTDESAGQDG